MARNTFPSPGSWIPEAYDSNVLVRVTQTSGIERFAKRIPMDTDTRGVPRTGAVGISVVPRGSAYPEDTAANDDVILVTRKFGTSIRLADEDLKDSAPDIINAKQLDWATAYAKEIDNACLAVNAASNGTTVPFNSVYWALSQANAATGYTAGANLTKTAGALTYTLLSNLFAKVEQGDFYDDGSTVLIAHPAFKAAVRNLVDTTGQPIFTGSQTQGTPDQILGFPVVWSNGAKVTATASSQPSGAGGAAGVAGNPIMVVANSNFLLLGARSGPESAFAPADSGPGFSTDEALVKMRARRAFVLGNENAAAVLELTTS